MTEPKSRSPLEDLIRERTAAEEAQYKPHIEIDGSTGVWDTGVIRGAVPDDFGPLFREALEASGQDPSRLRLGSPLKESHWQQRARNTETGEFETVWLHAYKFQCVPLLTSAVDIEAIVGRSQESPAIGSGPYWLVFQASDLQIGKRSRDGSTESIVERYIDSVALAKEVFRDKKRLGIEGIQISMPGDCVEGVVSQNSKNLWLTQETITEQLRIFRRLMMHTIEEFAPLVDKVYLDVVNGNHDEAMRIQNTYPGNGWATECAIQVHDAIQLNPVSYGHVQVRTPEKWSGFMTVPVGNTNVCVAHGHQWSRGKAFDWWAKQAIANQPPAAAQILQHGHWHELQLNSNADRISIGSATYDCGSDWYRNNHGSSSRRGGLVYLLNNGNFSDMSIV